MHEVLYNNYYCQLFDSENVKFLQNGAFMHYLSSVPIQSFHNYFDDCFNLVMSAICSTQVRFNHKVTNSHGTKINYQQLDHQLYIIIIMYNIKTGWLLHQQKTNQIIIKFVVCSPRD